MTKHFRGLGHLHIRVSFGIRHSCFAIPSGMFHLVRPLGAIDTNESHVPKEDR
jgi:hypothetical protein